MAQILYSDEERERRIELIGEYRLKTGESTRKIAKYFSSTQFPISYVTVLDYLERYIKKHPGSKSIIDKQTEENTPNSVKDPKVKLRVLKVAKLIQEGFTIEEISSSMNEEYWVIYRDIKNRLPMIDKKLSDIINEVFSNRSLENLKNQNGQKK